MKRRVNRFIEIGIKVIKNIGVDSVRTSPHGENIVSISAKTGEGLDELLAAIGKRLDAGVRKVTLHLPYDQGGILDKLYQEAKVEKVEYSETIDVVAVCTPKTVGQVKQFIEGYEEPKEDWEL